VKGAFATQYFILFNQHVAGTITAQGRDLTKTMDAVNEKYWYEQWHLDYELHSRLGVKNVTPILKKNGEEVSIYADTDSLFVSFEPAIQHCEWQNLFINKVDSIDSKFAILEYRQETKTDNQNCLGIFRKPDDLKRFLESNKVDHLIIDGYFVKDRQFNSKELQELLKDIEIRWNWFNELDFIHGIDGFRFGAYFKNCLEEYAESFGVKNR
jgi:hypothetical protein